MKVTATRRASARHSAAAAHRAAFRGLLLRDLTVLRKNLTAYLPGIIMQPLLLVFVFTYLFPVIGTPIGGDTGARFSTLLMPGIVTQAIVFQCLWSVTVPMIREFDITTELEDRVLAPAPLSTMAIEKIVAGAIHGLMAAAVVFPFALFVPITPVSLSVKWPLLLSILPLVCLASAALAVFLGTLFDHRSLPRMFSFIVMPLSFMGALFYAWESLGTIRWLQLAVLGNPLVYMSEGLRASLVSGVSHLPLPAVYPALVGCIVLLGHWGIRGFERRVLR